jgi:hypothetical protein
VTHEPAHPHGCRIFQVKSARLPSVEVELSSGASCHAFEPKRPRA